MSTELLKLYEEAIRTARYEEGSGGGDGDAAEEADQAARAEITRLQALVEKWEIVAAGHAGRVDDQLSLLDELSTALRDLLKDAEDVRSRALRQIGCGLVNEIALSKARHAIAKVGR